MAGDIEKTTMTTGRVVAIIGATIGATCFLVATYFTTMAGVTAGFAKINEKMSEQDKTILSLGFENRLQNISIDGNKESIKLNYEMFKSHVEKCENPNLKIYTK